MPKTKNVKVPLMHLGHFYEDFPLYQVISGRTDTSVFLREARLVASLAAARLAQQTKGTLSDFNYLELFSGLKSNFNDHIKNYLRSVRLLDSKSQVSAYTTELRKHAGQSKVIHADLLEENTFKDYTGPAFDMVYTGSEDWVCLRNESRPGGVKNLITGMRNAASVLNKDGFLIVPFITTQNEAEESFAFPSSTASIPVEADSALALRYGLPANSIPLLVVRIRGVQNQHKEFEQYFDSVKLATADGTVVQEWRIDKPNVLKFYERKDLLTAASAAGFKNVLTMHSVPELQQFSVPNMLSHPELRAVKGYRLKQDENCFLFSK